jgi:hypothetical protein
MIFSCIFLSILRNIGLYFYTVKYKFNIKILGFCQNIAKKIIKQKNIFCFHAYGQVSQRLKNKSSHHIFIQKKNMF